MRLPTARVCAFTLLELLVAVTIIVILIAVLVPALDKAVTAATNARCLSNVRTVAQHCLVYAQDNETALPAYAFGSRGSSAYDMRALNAPFEPLSTGLLVGKYLPGGPSLGKTVHCPVMDNSAHPTTGWRGICMNVVHGAGVGGGYWDTHPATRVIAGYNYRAASYFNHSRVDSAGNPRPKGVLKTAGVNSSFLIYVDSTDWRFAATRFGHPDGYNRAFGDGSAGWFADPNKFVEAQILAKTGGQGVQDGLATYANVEEEIYEYMSTRSVAEE
jgi:hypothetical protein